MTLEETGYVHSIPTTDHEIFNHHDARRSSQECEKVLSPCLNLPWASVERHNSADELAAADVDVLREQSHQIVGYSHRAAEKFCHGEEDRYGE